jgi:sterol desaturase/sphingolipid hydroxylase (fatty acid hydroxylase superfamily)
MPEFLQGTPITTLAAPFFILLILMEIFYIKVRKKGGEYESKDATTSVMMGLGSTIVDGLIGFVTVGILLFAYQLAPIKLPVNWLTGIACFVLVDLAYYWIHRYYHRSRWAGQLMSFIIPRSITISLRRYGKPGVDCFLAGRCFSSLSP